MEFLALQLSNSGGTGREVIDKTAITELTTSRFTGLPVNDAIPSPDSNEPDLITALQEQLGLRLEPQKAQVEMLVIDHAEKPSEN